MGRDKGEGGPHNGAHIVGVHVYTVASLSQSPATATSRESEEERYFRDNPGYEQGRRFRCRGKVRGKRVIKEAILDSCRSFQLLRAF